MNLNNWLEGLYHQKIDLILLNNDASFRKYYRFLLNQQSLIAVDSPPMHEKNQEFISIQKLLSNCRVRVPKIMQIDLEKGFFVLEDLGNQTLLPLLLNLQKTNSDPYFLYNKCLDELIKIQLAIKQDRISNLPGLLSLPIYNTELLKFEMELFTEWFLQKYLNFTLSEFETQLLNDLFYLLIENAHTQPQVVVHRDFHSRNLMLVEMQQVAVIDFQDAVLGPVTYDLASLFRDCYIAWPIELVKSWTEKYFGQLKINKIVDEHVTTEQFWNWFLQMSLQRNLKAVGIFARLFLRDNKPGYIKDIPRTLSYAIEVTGLINNKIFQAVHQLLVTKIIPAMNAKNTSKAFLYD